VAYEVTISPRAKRDLEEIRSCISQDAPDEAHRFVARLLRESYTLEFLPRRGAEIEGANGARLLVFRSYLNVYRVFEVRQQVRILRYWHSGRDINRLHL
jgi:addiction module RelE/StbE family toxin